MTWTELNSLGLMNKESEPNNRERVGREAKLSNTQWSIPKANLNRLAGKMTNLNSLAQSEHQNLPKSIIPKHSQNCEQNWTEVHELWTKSDDIVLKILAEAKGGPQATIFRQAGYENFCPLEEKYAQLVSCVELCHNPECLADRDRLLEIVGRNLNRINHYISSPQEETSKPPLLRPSKLNRDTKVEAEDSPKGKQDDSQTSSISSPQEDERCDTEYLEWKAWTRRHEENQEAKQQKIEEAGRKHESWALVRECNELLRRNHTKWMERKVEEKENRRLEEKEHRLNICSNKKKILLEKLNKRKETKAEKSRRLETERKMAGKNKMRSDLWKQRREKDGNLVRVWKALTPHEETPDLSSLEEEDKWMEELTLSDDERRALEALENTYRMETEGTGTQLPSCSKKNQPALRNTTCQPRGTVQTNAQTMGPENGPGKTIKAAIVDKLTVRERVNKLEVREGVNKLDVREAVNKLDVREGMIMDKLDVRERVAKFEVREDIKIDLKCIPTSTNHNVNQISSLSSTNVSQSNKPQEIISSVTSNTANQPPAQQALKSVGQSVKTPHLETQKSARNSISSTVSKSAYQFVLGSPRSSISNPISKSPAQYVSQQPAECVLGTVRSPIGSVVSQPQDQRVLGSTESSTSSNVSQSPAHYDASQSGTQYEPVSSSNSVKMSASHKIIEKKNPTQASTSVTSSVSQSPISSTSVTSRASKSPTPSTVIVCQSPARNRTLDTSHRPARTSTNILRSYSQLTPAKMTTKNKLQLSQDSGKISRRKKSPRILEKMRNFEPRKIQYTQPDKNKPKICQEVEKDTEEEHPQVEVPVEDLRQENKKKEDKPEITRRKLTHIHQEEEEEILKLEDKEAEDTGIVQPQESIVKKTSPTQKLVKTGSSKSSRKKTSDIPLSTRMKPLMSPSRTKLFTRVKSEPRNSPKKTLTINSIINQWKKAEDSVLTKAIGKCD